MSNPFNPNRQPMPGSGQYPAGQQLGGAYGQQPSQQMPGAGGYSQNHGFGQQPQQGYYQQGQSPSTPYGVVPKKKRTDLIIDIIAAVLVIATITGIAIWTLNRDDSDPNVDSLTMLGTPSQASDPATDINPMQPPVGTNPAQPPVGTNPTQGAVPGNGSGGQDDMKE